MAVTVMPFLPFLSELHLSVEHKVESRENKRAVLDFLS